MNTFSKHLKELRNEKNLSQSELARELGLSSSAISRWEKEEREPTLSNIIALCKYFKCTADYIMGLEEW